MRRGTRRRVTLAFLVVPVSAAGCTPPLLNVPQLERRLERQVSDRLNVDGIEITCPAGIEAEEGDRFSCVARAPTDPEELRIDVTQLDDGGSVTWEIAPGGAG